MSIFLTLFAIAIVIFALYTVIRNYPIPNYLDYKIIKKVEKDLCGNIKHTQYAIKYKISFLSIKYYKTFRYKYIAGWDSGYYQYFTGDLKDLLTTYKKQIVKTETTEEIGKPLC